MNLFISKVTTKWSKYETWQHRSAKVIRSKIIFYRIWKLIYGLLVSIFRGYMYFVFFGTIRHTRRMWRKFPTEIQAKYCWDLKLFKSVNRGHTEITTGWLAVNGTTTKCCGFWATSQMSQSTKSDGARMRVKRLQSALCFCSRNIYWKIKTLMLDTLWECRLQMGDC